MKNIPAFPRPSTPRTLGQEGMTLRDYFAGQAMQALIQSNWDDCARINIRCANTAYSFADAMLKQRGVEEE